MKKFSIAIFSLLTFFGFTACSSDDDIVFVAQPDTEAFAFSNSFAEVYRLTSNNRDNLAERFVWNELDFQAPTTINYELQGSPDNEFSSVTIFGTTSGNNLAVTVGDLLGLAADAGLDNDPTTEDKDNTGALFFRVRAYAGDGQGNALEQFSDTAAINVELPEGEEPEEPTFTNLFFVGDATAAGWNPDNNNTPLFRDPENPEVFHFQGRFAGGAAIEGFKLLEVLGQWQPQWGGTNGVLGVNPGDGEDPSAFPVDKDAYFSLTADLGAMTYTWEEIDPSAATTYNQIGIIGTATTGNDDGWNQDIGLTQSDFDPHLWYINDLELFEGEAKFRADGAWDVSWGATHPLSGQGANDNDPNIPVSPGIYDIWFNTLDSRYIFIPQN